MEKTFYSTSETARLFNINRVTIYRWIKEGKVKAHKIGKRFKVPHSEIDCLLREMGLPGMSAGAGRSKPLRPKRRAAKEPRKLVLAIDQDPDALDFIRAFFAETDLDKIYRLKIFSNGIEAALQIGRENPDIVLLDVTLPGLNGSEFAGKVRSIHPGARIIFLAPALLRTKGCGKARKNLDTIVKPLSLKKLNRALGRRDTKDNRLEIP